MNDDSVSDSNARKDDPVGEAAAKLFPLLLTSQEVRQAFADANQSGDRQNLVACVLRYTKVQIQESELTRLQQHIFAIRDATKALSDVESTVIANNVWDDDP